MKQIPLTRGMFVQVDDEDYEWLSAFRWHANHVGGGRFYAARHVGPRTAHKLIRMHRMILNAQQPMRVDHINHDTLDNTRANLRLVTASQNQANRLLQVDSNSGFKGVYWSKKSHKWVAQLKSEGRPRYLGAFADKEEAARTYDKAALEMYGEFALVNFGERTCRPPKGYVRTKRAS